MPDFPKIKRNINRMIEGGASDKEIAKYVSSEDVTAEQLRAAPKASPQEAATGATGRGLREHPTAPAPVEDDPFFITEDVPQKGLIGGKERTITTKRTKLTPKGQRAALELAPQLAIGFIPGLGAGAIATRAALSGAAGVGSSLLAEQFDPSESPLQKAITSGLLGTVGEVLPSAVLAKLAKPSKALKPGAKDVIESLAAEGQRPLPAQVTTATGTDLLQTFGESSLLAGGAVRRQKEKLSTVSQNALKGFIEDFQPTVAREEAGEIIQNALEGGLETQKLAVSNAYRKVDEAGGFEVDIRPLKQRLQELAAPEKGAVPATLAGEVKGILDRPDFITFEEAANRLSDFGSAQAPLTEGFRDKTKGAFAQAFKTLDKQIDNAGKELNPATLELWKEAKSLSKQQHKEFNTKFIKGLIRQETPERVYQAGIKTAQPSSIRKVRDIVMSQPGGAEKWRGIQGQYLIDTARKASTEGDIVGKKLSTILQNDGRDRIAQIFPEVADQKRLKTLSDQLVITQSDPDSGAYSMAFKFGQIASLGGMMMLQGGGTTGSAMLISSAAMAHIIKSKAAFELLVTGFEKAGLREGTTAFAKLGGMLAARGLAPADPFKKFSEEQGEARGFLGEQNQTQF